uniref:Uncharacterized protein n=1 Tax=Panagrolaimus davidi TaxID=227884 RepID=A0A914PFJ1_9BILA
MIENPLENAAFTDWSGLMTHDKQSKISSFCSLDKKDSSFSPSEYLNDSQKTAKQNQWKKESDLNKTKGSTLSLHISAYENDTVADYVISQSLPRKDMDSGKRLEATKHYFTAESTAAMFEIPRQQTDELKKPEIMQFKASQKLIDPNQENRREVENNDAESEFQKFKEKANILFQEEKYNEAIKAYSDALELSNISSENQAVIYSNRSASYLMLGNSLNSAKIDAEKAIKCWPSWWKGYYRLARVNVLQKEWKKAEETAKLALFLNPESKLALDELYDARHKVSDFFLFFEK